MSSQSKMKLADGYPANAPSTVAPELDHAALRERVGRYVHRQRMNIQHFHSAEVLGPGRTRFHPENSPLFRLLLKIALKCTGLHGLSCRAARNIRLWENRIALRRLPEAFQGFRILHLSDLHLDLDQALTATIIEAVKNAEYDACVITGDFRAETWGDHKAAVAETTKLAAHLKGPVYAVLGNHDCLEMLPAIEAAGIRVLMNEHVAIERDSTTIYLAGIDDPHHFETDNLEKALRGIPPEATNLLLSHTAETYRQALAAGVDYLFAGHTHGGQICLPGGIALITNARHPRALIRGAWRTQDLQGYTSAGAGASMIPCRLFCPPEITLHTLHRAPSPEAREQPLDTNITPSL